MAVAATFQSQNSIEIEDELLLRLFLLIKNVGTSVCRKVFHQYFPDDKKKLYQVLLPYKKILKPLLFQDQHEILFENANDEVDSSNFDITLFMLLLRKCCPKLQPPKNGWNKRPSITDTSEGANLERLRRKRNSLAHCGCSKLTSTEFDRKWNSCSDLLVKLGADISEIDTYATIQLDCSSRNNKEDEISILNDRLFEYMDASLVNFKKNEDKIKLLQDEIQILREIQSLQLTTSNSSIDDELLSHLKNHYLHTEDLISCLEWDIRRKGVFKLEQLYVEINLCYWNERNSLSEYDHGNDFYTTIKQLNDEMVARRNICILSDPGKGKTVLLQKIALDYAKNNVLFKEHFPNKEILILIRCKDLLRHKSITEYITDVYFKGISLYQQQKCLEILINKSKDILFLIDGYEEMMTSPHTLNGDNDGIAKQLDYLIEGKIFHRACVITTSRPFGLNTLSKKLSLFKRKYVIPSLDANQIFEYIKKYFWEKDEKFCSNLFEDIFENDKIKELSKSPLTLSIICNIYDHSENIPSNISDIYHELIKQMIEQFKANNGFSKPFINQKRRVSELLFNGIGQIALESLKNGKDCFVQDDLAKHFTNEVKKKNSLMKKFGVAKRDVEQVTPTTILQLGFLRSDNGNNPRRLDWYYHFEPKLCQKYLAAEFIVQKILKHGVKKGLKKVLCSKEEDSIIILKQDHELCLFIVDSLGRRGEKEICKEIFNELFHEFGNLFFVK